MAGVADTALESASVLSLVATQGATPEPEASAQMPSAAGHVSKNHPQAAMQTTPLGPLAQLLGCGPVLLTSGLACWSHTDGSSAKARKQAVTVLMEGSMVPDLRGSKNSSAGAACPLRIAAAKAGQPGPRTAPSVQPSSKGEHPLFVQRSLLQPLGLGINNFPLSLRSYKDPCRRCRMWTELDCTV